MSVKLQLFSAGHCKGIENIVLKTGKWKVIRFPALFAWIQHPKKGHILFDTGYASRVFSAAKKFPYQLYPLITPITFAEKQSAANQLRSVGVPPNEINTIIISHFHTDHIGGLKDFPNAKYIYFKEAYDSVKKRKGFSALRAAFLPDLIPDDFSKRSHSISDANDSLSYSSFPKGVDLFGDGSILGVPLPGHAEGQMGLILKQDNGQKVFLVADACWVSGAYRYNTPPNFIGKLVPSDYPQFLDTLTRLHQFHREHPDIAIIPTHCDQTAADWIRRK